MVIECPTEPANLATFQKCPFGLRYTQKVLPKTVCFVTVHWCPSWGRGQSAWCPQPRHWVGGAVPPPPLPPMAGSRHGPALLGSASPSLQLGTETVAASDQVRVVGVTMTSDLCLDKHIASVRATCFYWLRQLRRVRRSLDAESAATLVHAFVTSRMDYCNAILAGESPVYHRQAPASTACCRSRRQRHAEVRPQTQPSPARRAALAGRSSAGALQAVRNGPSMSAAQTSQSTTV